MIEHLILARHGESEFSANGLVNGDPTRNGGLTPRGRAQAAVLGRNLDRVPLDLCITSEFPRVRETAEIALAGRNVPVRTLAQLNDPRAGVFEGGPATEYGRWHDGADWGDAPPGGGESQLEIVERYLAGFRKVVDADADSVLVVAHALPIGFAVTIERNADPLIRRRYDDDIALATPIEVAPSDLRKGLERAELELRSIRAH